MPRGKKELAEQIIPKLREVEVEVGRGKTVLERTNDDRRATRIQRGFSDSSTQGTGSRCVNGSEGYSADFLQRASVIRPVGLRGLGLHVQGKRKADRDEGRTLLCQGERYEHQYSQFGAAG